MTSNGPEVVITGSVLAVGSSPPSPPPPPPPPSLVLLVTDCPGERRSGRAGSSETVTTAVPASSATRTSTSSIETLGVRDADVGQPIEHVGFRGRAVATRPPELLIVGLNAARQIGVEDVAHIRLVDPHAESDSGDDDDTGSVMKMFWWASRSSRSIPRDREAHAPVRHQQGGGFLRLLAGQAVDDAALACMARNESTQLLQSPFISTDSLMFGRSKPRMKGSTAPLNSRWMMSSRVTSHRRSPSVRRSDPGKEVPQPAQVL